MKNLFVLFICFILIMPTTSFADDNLDLEGIEDSSVSEVYSDSSKDPLIYSNNVIVIDRKTLSILYEKNPYQQVAMASTTKIMTCIIALEKCSLNETVKISKKASNVSGSSLGLIENMDISLNDLLYGLMLRSGNDCAVAIAEHISGSVEEFSKLMNQKAKELKLEKTNFVTPHGLDDPNHYTTAYDLAILTDYALKNEKFKSIVSTKTCTISFNGYPRAISNTNELLGNLDGVYGVKTGFTFEAGRCLVSACKRNNMDIIVVVLGANTKKIRTTDSSKLINYIFNNYKYVDISSIVNNSFDNYILKFNNNYSLEKTTTKPVLKLEKLDNYEFPLSDEDIVHLSTKIYTINKFSPSIEKNSQVGELHLYNKDNLVCKISIILDNQLQQNNWKYYFKTIICNFSK